MTLTGRTADCVDCGRAWVMSDLAYGHCARCRADLFEWHRGADFATDPIPEEKLPWLILVREDKNSPWRVLSSHIQGTWFRYADIDKAAAAMRSSHTRKKNEGNAMSVRSDRVHNYVTEKDPRCSRVPNPPKCR